MAVRTVSGNGNEKAISTEILDAEVDEDRAWALVAGLEAAEKGRPYEITLDSDWMLCIRPLEQLQGPAIGGALWGIESCHCGSQD